MHCWTPISPKRSKIDQHYEKHVRTNLNSSHRKGSGENTGSLVRRRDDSKVGLRVSDGKGWAGAEEVGAALLGQDSCKEQATDSLNTKSKQKPGQYGPGWLSQ